MSSDPKAAKIALRARQKVVREQAFARYGDAAAQALKDHGLGFAAVRAPAWVSAFYPIGDELDPMPLLERLIGEGYGVCLPVMEGKGLPLVFRAWKPGDPLNEVTWGIKEPLAAAPVIEPDIEPCDMEPDIEPLALWSFDMAPLDIAPPELAPELDCASAGPAANRTRAAMVANFVMVFS